MRDCGANQTCDQVKIFGNYVRWYVEIPCFDPLLLNGFIGSTIAQAIHKATRAPKGPVHLNCLFREPFLLPIDRITPSASTYYETAYSTLSPSTIDQWSKKLLSYERGVIIVGALSSSVSRRPIYALSEQLGWPILPDILSGLRCGHPNIIPYYNTLLENVGPNFKPECILHFGDRLISKIVLLWIKNGAVRTYAMIADQPHRFDPEHQLTHRVQCEPAFFCEAILKNLGFDSKTNFLAESKNTPWINQWKEMSNLINSCVDEYIPSESEPGVIRFLQSELPPHFALFLANSMPIRDAEQFFFPPLLEVVSSEKEGLLGSMAISPQQ